MKINEKIKGQYTIKSSLTLQQAGLQPYNNVHCTYMDWIMQFFLDCSLAEFILGMNYPCEMNQPSEAGNLSSGDE